MKPRVLIRALPVTLGVLLSTACTSLFFGPSFPVTDAMVEVMGILEPVEILRDSYGIGHVYAESLEDLMFAQGYLHAQDRLFQMELWRRLAQGRLAEVAGEAALPSDIFARVSGFTRLQDIVEDNLGVEDRRILEAYAAGVNEYLAQNRDKLPGEYRLLGAEAEPWEIRDSFAIISAISWFFLQNLNHEMFMIESRNAIDRDTLDLLLGSHPGAELPADSYFEEIRPLDIGPFLPETKAFFSSFFGVEPQGGSNSWTVADGPGGKPIFANDTHMTATVPNIWYINHLSAPDFEAAGFSLAGTPGVAVGHNGSISWGYTSLNLDGQDLFVLELDPENPKRYRVGDRWQTMTRRDIAIPLAGGEVYEYTAWDSEFGPVITQLEPGITGAVALMWYGSVDDPSLTDRTFGGLIDLARAKTIDEAEMAASQFSFLTQNLLAADSQGGLLYKAVGAIPRREGYSGRLPAWGSGGVHRWDGFYDYQSHPRLENPETGYIVSANNRKAQVMDETDVASVGWTWSQPYRSDRIEELVVQGLDVGHDPQSFTAIQMDIYENLADVLLPPILAMTDTIDAPDARFALEELGQWDRNATAESREALIFSSFGQHLVEEIAGDELGEHFDGYMSGWMSIWTLEDVIFDHLDDPVWDDVRTEVIESPVEIVERALVKTIKTLEDTLGSDRDRWAWGSLHRIVFAHPAGSAPVIGPPLNRGPFSLPGSLTTVNVNGYWPSLTGYDVIGIPNMRIVVPLADPDQSLIVLPPGQSGIPSHPNYDDQIEPWMSGQSLPFPFTRSEVERIATSTLVLTK